MDGDLVIGIDVGTTAVKAGLLDSGGTLIDDYAAPYPTNRPDSALVEQDPESWVSLVSASLERLAANGLPIAALGICSQVNTHVFVGADGAPLFPAIVWQDGRASSEAAELDARVTDEQRMAWWGAPLPIDASNVLARMLWMARHRSDIWEETKHVMLPKDYCIFRLTGELTADPLSNIGLVGKSLDYIPEVLDLVPGAAERLVPPSDMRSIVGRVRHGPASGVPVANGTMDAWTGLLGCGGHADGTTVYLSGTSEILGITSRTVSATPGIVVFPEYQGIRLHAGPTQSGGASQMWYCGLQDLRPEQMAALAARSDYARPAPIFLPHLHGERAPIWNADARALFLGIEERTCAADMARSVYEGVAFSARHLLQSLEASAGVRNDVINCGGGGFQTDIWNQIRANVLARQCRRLAVKDPGVLGAAGLAGWAIEMHPDLSAVFRQITRFDRTYEPDAKMVALYEQLFPIYVDAISANAELCRAWLNVDARHP
ncbi:xylulokinase [Hoeflea poritis]|uniref:FGGY-family carbohydrate kinase n=1 Tax=Hoeflea poritis TaxID=2993659 RepID=A0ABT4VQC4_9HYPH|nr:FGGY-family carbohydrate kinase [Hoeflea poritis]MDA4846920.1 FGGY-family carbohydrate kinase [Hoeflea poritis]